MEHEKNDEIFDQYNPASDVVRCPYGRSGVRKELDRYAFAALNLYGIISREELVEIFNAQNESQTTPEELYILLLPLIRKEKRYCFYKDHVIHEFFFNSPEATEELMARQKGKPRYLPEREEFLEYTDARKLESEQYRELWKWTVDTLGFELDVILALSEIGLLLELGGTFHQLLDLLECYDLAFPDDKKAFRFYDLYADASNHQRLWDHKGHTPLELKEIEAAANKNVVPFPEFEQRTKVGRNDPCPCGSGKKYKKCCGLQKNLHTATLSTSEAKEFYQTFYDLLTFVNNKAGVLKRQILPGSLGELKDWQVKKISDHLWDNPQLIDDYLAEKGHSPETIEVLTAWRTRFLKSDFLIVEYTPDHAVFLTTMGEGEEAKDQLLAVKGLKSPVSDILRRPLPLNLETVLLPFRGKIVYDTWLPLTLALDPAP